MAETPDYTQAGEVFRATMEAALANIDKVNADLLKEREKVADLEMAAREELKRIEREATQLSQSYMDQHRKEYLETMKLDLTRKLVKNLILDEVPSNKLKRALELDPKLLADIWMDIGFEALGDMHIGHVGYEDHGPTGTVIFYREDLSLRFEREFGGGTTLAIIHVPSTENWVYETRLPLEERMLILEFVAKRIIRDQATDYQYQIDDHAIRIFVQ